MIRAIWERRLGSAEAARAFLRPAGDDGPDAAREFKTMVSPRFVSRKSTGPAPIAQPLSF